MPEETLMLPVEAVAEMIALATGAGGAYDLVVTGWSMSPTLHPGRDTVRLVSPQKRAVRRGEIVFAARRSGGYMLHRVLRCKPGVLTLNGDGQVWTEDVDAHAVLAVVESFERAGRHIRCDAIPYRCYVALWGFTRPLRAGLVRIKKMLTGKAGGR